MKNFVSEFKNFSSKSCYRLPTNGHLFVGCSFRRCYIGSMDFTECKFLQCDFTEACLFGTNLRSCTFSDCLFDRTLIDWQTVLGPGATGCRGFVRVKRRGDTYLAGMYLKNHFLCEYRIVAGNLDHAELSGATFCSSSLRQSSAVKVNFSQSVFTDMTIEGTDFSGATFAGTCFRNTSIKDSQFHGASFVSAVFDGTNSFDIEARRQMLEQGANFVYPGVDLRGANLRGAILQDLDLSNADLTGADLRNTYIAFTSLKGARLYGARLHGARFRESCLDGALFDKEQLKGVRRRL